MGEGWTSYDSAADSHDRLAVPAIFAQPAKDLVTRMELRGASTVLDVGSGTGVAACLAAASSDTDAVVVALDPSLEMLRVGRSKGLRHLVRGAVPGLPFCDGKFDRVMANFVISHLPSYRKGLLDMVRVLHAGGRLGVTAWGTLDNEFREYWESLAESAVGKEPLERATQTALPWEDWFNSEAHLCDALQEAGLLRVQVDQAFYETRISIADFLSIRENSTQARFIRRTLNNQQWEEFKATLTARFYKRFHEPLEHVRDTYIAVGDRA
jgi:ubiquinone/menaquinone biosynthesis C-methylase UbiE